MIRLHRLTAAIALIGVLGLAAQPACASGPASGGPAYVDVFGGETADLDALYGGRLGVVMASSPRAFLFIDWRLLHGLPVGADAGKGLSVPCCGEQPDTSGSFAWLQARQAIPGVTTRDNYYLDPDRPLPNNASEPNCFGEAFDTATKTLQDRVKAYGADSPWVRAWIAGQDAVFDACHNPSIAMPPLDAAAPAWLKADRAYQAAALNLYLGNNAAAAQGFAAIARDATSPWRPSAPYLVARSWLREASNTQAPKAFAEAHRAINALAAMPPATFGQSQAAVMAKVLAIREHPDQALANLAKTLNAPTLAGTAAADFRDYLDLNDKVSPDPPILDWIATIKGGAAGAPASDPTPDPGVREAKADDARRYSLAHARAVWAKTHDVAWLVAALSLVDPADPDAPALAAEAARVPAGSPAYLTAAYNRVRLTINAAPQGQTRAALDGVLARGDLSASDRNLFTAERLQVAEDLPAFARLALRKRLCAESDDKSGCVRGQWNEEVQAFSVYDEDGSSGKIGLGPEARAMIDRLPLAERTALAGDADLPAKLRMDIALTTWTRAVLMGDDAKVDTLSKLLGPLLPPLAGEFARVASTPPGEDKRFSEYLILAKVPGLATDLEIYTRPEGAVDDFQGHWPDWMVLPVGATTGDSAPPCLEAYLPDGGCSDGDISDATLWPKSDLVCLTYCGESGFPLRRPDVVAAASARGVAERKRMLTPKAQTPDAPAPAQASSVWEAVLAYVRAHPADPRAPEALYWLVHVSHFGDSHNHSGHRAFDLLHQRYPTSPWTKKTKYYYD